MLTNSQIKKKELFKATQGLIRVNGDFKKVQHDLLLSLNECAMSEYNKEPSIKQSIKMLKFKQVLKRYFAIYGDKIRLEEHISELRNWKATEPVYDKE